MNRTLNDSLGTHYAGSDLLAAVQRALATLDAEPGTLSPRHWAALDEFHVRGAEATRALAGFLGVAPGWRVLDLGCGLGGAARYLAREHHCRVLGLDLTADYCRVGQWLTRQLGLTERVAFIQADAAHLPLTDGAFDAVWTQHTAMNIPDKAGLYAGIRRVLKPTGQLALYDVLAGPGGEPHFPVPWASEPAQSFLATPDELRQQLHDAGFTVSHWRDVSAAGLTWFERQAARGDGSPRALGLHLLLGSALPTMIRNLRRNLAEGRVILLEAVARVAA